MNEVAGISGAFAPNATNSSVTNASTANVVKEGWLFKRGEHIKNWRSRYVEF